MDSPQSFKKEYRAPELKLYESIHELPAKHFALSFGFCTVSTKDAQSTCILKVLEPYPSATQPWGEKEANIGNSGLAYHREFDVPEVWRRLSEFNANLRLSFSDPDKIDNPAGQLFPMLIPDLKRLVPI